MHINSHVYKQAECTPEMMGDTPIVKFAFDGEQITVFFNKSWTNPKLDQYQMGLNFADQLELAGRMLRSQIEEYQEKDA